MKKLAVSLIALCLSSSVFAFKDEMIVNNTQHEMIVSYGYVDSSVDSNWVYSNQTSVTIPGRTSDAAKNYVIIQLNQISYSRGYVYVYSASEKSASGEYFFKDDQGFSTCEVELNNINYGALIFDNDGTPVINCRSAYFTNSPN